MIFIEINGSLVERAKLSEFTTQSEKLKSLLEKHKYTFKQDFVKNLFIISVDTKIAPEVLEKKLKKELSSDFWKCVTVSGEEKKVKGE